MVYEFDAEILQSDEAGAGAFVLFPHNVTECFGKSNLIPVRVTFDGVPYRGSIANMGLGPCIGVLKSIRAQIGKQRGDTVHVTVEADDAPRGVPPPDDLRAALSETSLALFDALSPGNQRQYADFITSAKRAETRAARVAKAAALLENSVKNFRKPGKQEGS